VSNTVSKLEPKRMYVKTMLKRKK